MSSPTIFAMVFQALAIAIVLFVPFGFDLRSSFGLDFGHLLILLVAYGLALFYGVVSAIAERQFTAALAQVLVAAGTVIMVFTGAIQI